MLRARLLEHWLKLSTDSEKVKQTKKRGVRRKGKYAGKRSSGGGSQRAFFSRWLRGKRYRNLDEKKRVMTEGNRAYATHVAAGGVELQKTKELGQAMAVSHSVCGRSLPRKTQTC